MTETLSLRERTRRAVRAELIECGMDLFASQGYEETTVAQVAQAAGMSERSFFRYFDSKHELALANQSEYGHELAARLALRPADEDVWTALRRAFDPIVERIDRSDERPRRLIEMLHRTPELWRVQLSQRYEWAAELAPHIATHLEPLPTGSVVDPRPAAIAASAVMCYQAALDAWLEAGGAVPFGNLLDEALGVIAGIRD
jgi:AcrR family transcriptional regulator